LIDAVDALREKGAVAAGAEIAAVSMQFVPASEPLALWLADMVLDMEALEEARLLSKDRLLVGEFPAPADLDDVDDKISDPETSESPDNGAG
jgi:hypothetical protein